MQVDPALPWNNTVEGGTIALRSPKTLLQLLDGDLMVVLAGRDIDSFGYFDIYPSDNKLYISCGGAMQYRVNNVDTTSSSAVYSELTIEKLNDATFTLKSVYVRTSDVEVIPGLPLEQTGRNARMGELSFRGGITAQELIDGKYDFLLDDNGNPTPARLEQGSSSAKVDFYLNGDLVIYGTIRDGDILHLVATSEGGPALIEVKERQTLLNGIYCGNVAGVSNYVFKIEGTTLKPLYQSQSGSRANWWRMLYGVISTWDEVKPLPSYRIPSSILDEYGGGNENYEKDWQGEEKLTLDESEITILGE